LHSNASRKLVYTVGHSNRGLLEFISLLKRYGVAVVVDVRRFPTSRRFPWFKIHSLSEALPVNGIGYVWLGRLLGGFRPGGYEEYMKTREFKAGIEMLVDVIEAARGPAAVMCRERLWFKCHRRYISDVLASMGYTVVHIIDLGRTQKHKVRASG
jgi:uncharacterized protein (DUF488 family)